MLVQIILFDGFDLLDAIAPYEVLVAGSMAAKNALDVRFVSLEGARPVPSGPTGVPIPAAGALDTNRSSIIVLPGAAGEVEGDGPDTIPALLGRAIKSGLAERLRLALACDDIVIATVCGGSLVLALAGLLRDRFVVTHHMGMEILGATGAKPIQARVVEDGRLISGAGVTSGLDVGFHLLEKLLGPRVAHHVERLFEYERRGTVWRSEGIVPVPAWVLVNLLKNRMTVIEMHFEGEWDIVIATPIGQQKVRLAIRDTDGRLTGTATQGNEAVPFQNVIVDGDRLRWMQDVAKPFPLTIKFDITVRGDVMSGTAKAGVFPTSKLSGQRARGSG